MRFGKHDSYGIFCKSTNELLCLHLGNYSIKVTEPLLRSLILRVRIVVQNWLHWTILGIASSTQKYLSSHHCDNFVPLLPKQLCRSCQWYLTNTFREGADPTYSFLSIEKQSEVAWEVCHFAAQDLRSLPTTTTFRSGPLRLFHLDEETFD